jgi:hypothetical protein
MESSLCADRVIFIAIHRVVTYYLLYEAWRMTTHDFIDKYRDFIRNPEEILKEITPGYDRSFYRLTFRIFTFSSSFSSSSSSPSTSTSSSADTAISEITAHVICLRKKIAERLKREYGDYIWDLHPPQVYVALPDQWNTPTGMAENSAKGIPYILGSLDFRDSIDDEWYLVHLLLDVISTTHPDCFISIQDNDGDILLIEAAEFLPDWLDSENSSHRVWLKDGSIHLISQNPQHGLDLQQALSCLRSSSYARASNEIHSSIRERLSAYPMRNTSWRHRALCLLPAPIIKLLEQQPHLISEIVHSYCSSDRIQRRKYLSSCAFIRQYLPTATSVARTSSFAANSNTMRLISMPLSKIHYARMGREDFHIPKALQTYEKNIRSMDFSDRKVSKSNALPTAAEAVVEQVSRLITAAELSEAFLLGVKILSGIEILYQLQQQEQEQQAHTSTATGLTSSSIHLHVELPLSLRSIIKNGIEANEIIDERYIDKISSTKPISLSIAEEIARADQSLLRDCEAVQEQVLIYDDESWMTIDPQQLDEYMQKIGKSTFSTDQTSSNGNATATKASRAEVDGKAKEEDRGKPTATSKPRVQFSQIIDQVENFLQSESSAEAVDNRSTSSTAAARASENQDVDSKEKPDVSNTASMLAAYQQLLDNDDDEEEGEEEQVQETASSVSDTGVGAREGLTGCSAQFMNQRYDDDDDGLSSNASIDSDDELSYSNDLDADVDDEDFLASYEAAMDEELSASTLRESFERILIDGEEAVDIDVNLIKYLLESHAAAAQQGDVGPASQLLSQLGLAFPHALDD